MLDGRDVLLDAGPLVAALDPGDQWHRVAAAPMKALAGRCITTEAVNLAAGAQRSLTSAYAGLQLVLPVLAFALAARLGAPRRFKTLPP